MKKIYFLIFVLCLTSMTGCTNEKQDSLRANSNKNEVSTENTEDSSIKFYTIYNDFSTTTDEFLFSDLIQRDNQIFTFNSDDSWNEFKNKYFSEVKLPELFLLNKTLLCLPIFSAKPTLILQNYIDRITLNHNTLTVFINTTGLKYSGTENEKAYNLILATIDSHLLPQQVQIKEKYIGD